METKTINDAVEQLMDWNPPFKDDREEIKKLYTQTLTSIADQSKRDGYIMGTKHALEILSISVNKDQALESIDEKLQELIKDLPT